MLVSRRLVGAMIVLLGVAQAARSQEPSKPPPDKIPDAHEACGVQFMRPFGWDTDHLDHSLREGTCRIVVRPAQLWRMQDPDFILDKVTVTVLQGNLEEATRLAGFEQRNGKWQMAGEPGVAVLEIQRAGWKGLQGTTTISCPQSRRPLPPRCQEFRAVLNDGGQRSAIVVGGHNTKAAFELVLNSLTFLGLETYENSRCGFKFNYPSNWLVADREPDPRLQSACRIVVRPKYLDALLAEYHADVHTIFVEVFDGDLPFAAETSGFEYREEGWIVLGRHNMRGDAAVIESDQWRGLKGRRNSGCYQGKEGEGPYVGLCEMAAAVLNDRGNRSATIDALPQGWAVFQIILESFEFTPPTTQEVR